MTPRPKRWPQLVQALIIVLGVALSTRTASSQTISLSSIVTEFAPPYGSVSTLPNGLQTASGYIEAVFQVTTPGASNPVLTGYSLAITVAGAAYVGAQLHYSPSSVSLYQTGNPFLSTTCPYNWSGGNVPANFASWGPLGNVCQQSGTFSIPIPANGTIDLAIIASPDSSVTATISLPSGTPPPAPQITNPSNGAYPQSAFVALSGTGPAGATLDVLVSGVSVGTVVVNSAGTWEALPFLGGTNTVQVQVHGTSTSSNTIVVNAQLPSFNPSPAVPVSTSTYLPLEHADIFIAGGGTTSPQTATFGALYTHTALYLGGDSNGTPLVAEAVPNGGTFGEVRSLPLEKSTVWAEYSIVKAFRPLTALPSAERDSIVAWAKTATSQGLPYWSFVDFGLVAAADVLFDASGGVITPRLNLFLNKLNSRKYSTTTFICSTLVWRAYYEGTSHAVDLSQPNLMTPEPGSLMAAFSPSFINQLDSVFIVPETFVVSPQLMQIF